MTVYTEGGIRASRIEFVRENEQGVTPADPDFELFSNRVREFNPTFGPEMEEAFNMGEYVADQTPGLEENELEIVYDLNRWFKDASGNPQDPAFEGIERRSGIMGSITIVERLASQYEGQDGTGYIQPGQTVEGWYNDNPDATPKTTHVYSVAKAAEPDSPELVADPSDQQEWAVTMEYAVEHGRSYQIDQPEGDNLVVYSTDARDTDIAVTLEDEGAVTSEEINLDGQTILSTTNPYDSLDSVSVPQGQDHFGDIVVAINEADETTPTEGEALTVLMGSDFYTNTYGDPGVPPLGAGSRASPIDRDFYYVGNMTVLRGGNPVASNVQSIEFAIDNNTDRKVNAESREQPIHHGAQTPELSITLDGETESHQKMIEFMAGEEEDIEIFFDRGNAELVTIPQAPLTEGGERTREAGEVGGDSEVTYVGTEPVTVSNANTA